ncbi:hypothetical protein NQ176_g4230 [Zarea fungicola]|uniref:Uncharacterized protein n=1 Tax=Zarea fungicola TaxID=93591 RepID=A0ACC1NEK2_9HYPO|nr:hypothetical protein NQ176_g4230 [Lecanicillium fungicola]
MGKRMYQGSAVGVFPEAAVVSGDTVDDDSSSVHSSSTESMVDVVVPCLGGDERDDGGTDADGSLDEEGDSLNDDESRSAESDSTGSLADFIAPDWEMGDGEDDETAADDDYEDDGSTDGDEEDDGNDIARDRDDDRDDGRDEDRDEDTDKDRDNGRDEDRDNDNRDSRDRQAAKPKRICSPGICDVPLGCSSLLSCLRDTASCLQILGHHLQQLPESETEMGQHAAAA